MARSYIKIVNDGYRYKDYMVQSDELLHQNNMLSRTTIGSSVLGKPIHAWTIGHGPQRIHINAAVHANEWITTPLLMRFMEELASEFNEGCWKDVTLITVPMVNPDGVDLSQDGLAENDVKYDQVLKWNEGNTDFRRWKANIRGVDLNDQFPANWEVERTRRGRTAPSWQDYTGPSPLSEPEAIALVNLTRSSNFSRVMSLHSQGKEIYWNYRNMEPDYAEKMAVDLAERGGYQAVKLSGSDAGYKDWFIQEYRRPGFTVEVGEGVNPLPASRFNEFYEELFPILRAFIHL